VSARRLGALPLSLALIASQGVAIAQEAPSDVEDRRQRLETFDPGAAAEQSGADLALPDAPDPTASAQTTEAYQATLQAYYAYRKAGYEHRLGVFAWQSLSRPR
jgi:hypothetical protein